ncbi:hypothetical protein QN277_023084 [Acacia crassicarpa]|uniref:TIR domain-containing protein n=1 Tax=Acacia crassicarpa TaxID=499986 RepID=A0AAE1MLM6_9FABA|nr:hypothetical protein QN277_023084 [Acacia crassicarpa]
MSSFSLEFDLDNRACITISHHTPDVIFYLEKYFKDVGIKTWIDDMAEECPRADFKSCRMHVVVFTPVFLESGIFFKRLLTIRRNQELLNKTVVAVFCGLSEEQLREQVRPDSELWTRTAWILDSATAIAEVASISDFGNKLRSRKAHLSLSMLNDESFDDLPHHQVGLPRRVRELLKILRRRYILLDDTIIVGIWGAKGIGKTTIVKAFYDRIGGYFEGKSFLSYNRKVYGEENAGVSLMKQLIFDISETELNETNVVVMHEHMKEVLYQRRVLVVLDGVNSELELQKVCKNVKKCCGKGSLIFITSLGDVRFKYLRANIIYEMKRLNSEESLELFCLHAFKQFNPKIGFRDFSKRVIEYCEGLLLALEVFGSLLHKKTEKYWKRIVNKLEAIPHGVIQNKLKISVDSLTNTEKDLFFNIACFYVGQSEHYVTQLLRSSTLHVEMGMSSLIAHNLVKVMNDKLYVHDLLQEIGRKIIQKSKPKPKYSYDVFLSFRGDDTRRSFTSHLCAALKQASIEVYMDEERIERGEIISSSLLEAIESSRISIIIFSKNYADSSWCLQELDKIMECYKATSQEVLPIFFDVRPFEVRKQQNAFGKAWERLIKRTSISKRKKLTINLKRALVEVANLSGWDMHNHRTETELIDEVIETVTKKLGNNTCLFVAHHPVGLKSRMQDILQLLQSKSRDVIIAGVWGMGGIGKTTIAKAIYNEVGQNFEGKCFLTNVREAWKQENGHVHLQEQLLSDILKSRRMAIPNIEMGKTLLRQKLSKKRVIVVLDDVNNENQLNALCGSREWFGHGSRIIITTRDEHLLKILRVIHVYTMKELDDNESLELFSWHAFKQAVPEQDFAELSRRLVSYSGGLPLALEILGSYLFDREILIWESVLEKLQQIPNHQIHEILKINYDGLSDNTEKEIFLDICCFFVGKDKNYVMQILNGCGFYADIGIKRLIELSLVRVCYKNKLEMHNLLRDMGREIIREQSPKKPEKRTRLWSYDDVLDVLITESGTRSIEGLALNMLRNNSSSLRVDMFKKMKMLRLLQLVNVHLTGDYDYLSTNLRWLSWREFPLENMPMNFNLEKIVAIDLKWSNLVKVWKKSQLLEELKCINLSHSHYLTETPNFSNIPHLEKLILKDCPRLSIIHPSIGDLKCILLLNLKNCRSLNHLPRNVYKLKSLKTLIVCGCSKIDKLEEDIGQMESLTTLDATQTAIAQVPFSLVRLKSIKLLSICGYEGSPREVFPCLVLSWMSPTHRSKSLSRAFRIFPSLIRGISYPLFSRRYEIANDRPSTSQASCQNTPAVLEFQEQVNMKRLETLMTSLTIQAGWFNKTMDTLLKSISKVFLFIFYFYHIYIIFSNICRIPFCFAYVCLNSYQVNAFLELKAQ